MADTKISAMTASGALVGTEMLPLATTTTTNARATSLQIKQWTLGTSSASTLGFYGATFTSQLASASQAVVATTAPVSITATQWGYSTSTQALAVVTLLAQIRNDLVTLGLVKGAA